MAPASVRASPPDDAVGLAAGAVLGSGAGLADVLGTVAGDDTLMVVVSERAWGARVARRLSALAGL